MPLFSTLDFRIRQAQRKLVMQRVSVIPLIMNLLNALFALCIYIFWLYRLITRNEMTACIFLNNFNSILHIYKDVQYVIENCQNIREIYRNISFIHLYIIWQSSPNLWILQTKRETILCGNNGFIHEYIKLRYPSQVATIKSLPFSPNILDIQTFSGILPNYVQNWLPPCKTADVLLFPAHSDDEFVFLCGVIGKYSSNKSIQIQVSYICEFWTTDPIREHEKLDGLWKAGIRHYPITGPIPDIFPKRKAFRSLTVFKPLFYERIIKYVVEQIRRFKPLIVVGHDFFGEKSKHIMHILSSLVITNAVKITNDPHAYPDLVNRYGLWDTPKTYLHSYGNKQTNLDLFVPIPSRGNMTGYQIVNQSFYKHISQIKLGRYQVNIHGSLKCTSFGLYRSLVGPDIKRNDLFENIELNKVKDKTLSFPHNLSI